jgi:hypothetical protein
MEHEGQVQSFLMVNRVEVLDQAGCSACGREFSTNPIGEKALVLSVGNAGHTYFFCGTCGDNIMGRVESDQAKQRYLWDWAIPLRGTGRVSRSS